jgi:DNA-binding transcriptional LysR family regulator
MNIDGLTEFVAVTKTLSFTKAAQNLNVSVAHVSRRVAALEAKVGGRLLHRTTRSVTPTQLGEEFLRGCDQIDLVINEVFERVANSQADVSGPIKVTSMPGTFAEHVVLPALTEFADAHKGVDIEIDFSARHVDLRKDNFDFAVRSGPTVNDTMMRVPLAKRTRVVAASPTYLAEHGIPVTPDDLIDHQCLLSGRPVWHLEDRGRSRAVNVSGRFRSNSGPAVLQACVSGVGIAYLALAAFEDNFSSGALTPVLKDYWGGEQDIYLLADERRFRPHRILTAMNAIQNKAKTFQADEKRQLGTLRLQAES